MAVDPARAKTLFLNASDLDDPAERAAYLDRECGGDAELRARVEALLRANDDSPVPSLASTDETVVTGPRSVDPDATGECTPDIDAPRPGPAATAEYRTTLDQGAVISERYTLQEKIGEGGMGEVWVARQTEPVKRKVALKLIKTGMDSRSVIARFEQERQALAMMDHPNIAKVFDAGLTPTGQPFFVMELVNGLSLTKYCDEARLTPRERLELFVPICQAVQHAHQKGIVHRDLKPANILITRIDGRPVPKVIDFGVAKATAGKLTDESMSTQFGAIVGTLEYMSPEQAGFSGEDIDTRADIYSLGVILYELLTGLRPIDAKRLRKAALTEMIRIIHEEDPSKPSTRLSTDESLPSLAALRQIEPRRLMALLRGELDWVVMKCLEKQRERRYDTANSLARDIQRYLADEAVEARPPSAGYRLGKFLRRNKGPVLAASLVLLSLLGGIIGATLGLFEARRQEGIARTESDAKDKALAAEAFQRGEAERRLSQRDKANEILLGVFNDLNPRRSENKDQPLAALLGKRLEKAAAQLEGEATSDPANVAKMQVALGVSQYNLSNYTQAATLFANALAYYQKLGPDDQGTISTTDKLATAYIGAGRLDQALPLWEETCARSRVKLGPDDLTTLNLMTNLTIGYYSIGKLDRAAVIGEEAHERLKRTRSGNDPGTLAVANALVLIYQGLGKLDRAIALGEDTLALRMVTLGPNDPAVFTSMNNLALCYQQQGNLPRALSLFEDSLAMTRQTLGPDHSDTLNSLANLAEAYRVSGDSEKALALSKEAFTRMKTTLGRDHPSTLFGMTNLARIYVYSGKPEEAIPLHEEALMLKRSKLGDEHAETITSMSSLANAYSAVNRKDRALALYEEALAINRKRYGADHPTSLIIMGSIAQALLELGQVDKGFALMEECLRMSTAKMGADNPATLTVLNNLGEARLALGKTDQATEPLERAFLLRKAKLGADHPDTLRSMRSFAVALERVGNPDKGLPLLREVVEAWRRRAGEPSREYQAALYALGHNLLAGKKWAEAEAMLRPALSLGEKSRPDDWQTYSLKSMLGASLLGQKRFADAGPLLIAGYEGMKQREATLPPQAKYYLIQALERLVEFSEVTNKPEEAAKWRKELEARKEGEKKPVKP